MVSLILGISRPAMRDWALQRTTAILMLLAIVVLVGILVAYPPRDYATWKLVTSFELSRISLLVFLVSMCLHAWLGIKDVLMDYVKHTYMRAVLRILTLASLIGYSLWSMLILWG